MIGKSTQKAQTTEVPVGHSNVCPAIDDWDIDMLNEDREKPGRH